MREWERALHLFRGILLTHWLWVEANTLKGLRIQDRPNYGAQIRWRVSCFSWKEGGREEGKQYGNSGDGLCVVCMGLLLWQIKSSVHVKQKSQNTLCEWSSQAKLLKRQDSASQGPLVPACEVTGTQRREKQGNQVRVPASHMLWRWDGLRSTKSLRGRGPDNVWVTFNKSTSVEWWHGWFVVSCFEAQFFWVLFVSTLGRWAQDYGPKPVPGRWSFSASWTQVIPLQPSILCTDPPVPKAAQASGKCLLLERQLKSHFLLITMEENVLCG